MNVFDYAGSDRISQTLWSSLFLGSTATEVGVLRIMASLKEIIKWTLNEFWPCYKQHALDWVQIHA